MIPSTGYPIPPPDWLDTAEGQEARAASMAAPAISVANMQKGAEVLGRNNLGDRYPWGFTVLSDEWAKQEAIRNRKAEAEYLSTDPRKMSKRPVVTKGSVPESWNPPNPKQRYGDLRPAVQMVPPALLLYASQALGEGARKYGPYNWRDQPVEALTYVGACLRHLAAWQDGEELDPDSAEGKHHLAGAIGSLAILVDALEGGFLIDNRPKPGPGARLSRPRQMQVGAGTAATDLETGQDFIDRAVGGMPLV